MDRREAHPHEHGAWEQVPPARPLGPRQEVERQQRQRREAAQAEALGRVGQAALVRALPEARGGGHEEPEGHEQEEQAIRESAREQRGARSLLALERLEQEREPTSALSRVFEPSFSGRTHRLDAGARLVGSLHGVGRHQGPGSRAPVIAASSGWGEAGSREQWEGWPVMLVLLAIILFLVLASPANSIVALVLLVAGIVEVGYWWRTVKHRRLQTGAETLIGARAKVVS